MSEVDLKVLSSSKLQLLQKQQSSFYPSRRILLLHSYFFEHESEHLRGGSTSRNDREWLWGDAQVEHSEVQSYAEVLLEDLRASESSAGEKTVLLG